MALLSIIIPVYNVRKYLRQSLDSIFSQKEVGDCEILLINDGSTDDSLTILREYEKRETNVKVIDKVNEGVSATRNRGIEEATGDYIFFMDADDLLHPHSLAIILNNLSSSRPDILTWGYRTFYRKPDYKELNSEQLSIKLDKNPQEAFNYLMRLGFAVSIYSKAIKRSIIVKDIRFDTSMTYGEDMFFSWKAFLSSSSFEYLILPLYFYRQTQNSAVSRFHPQLFEKYRKAFDEIESFAAARNLDSKEMIKDIDYHFACRIPSLTNMESKAPYSKEEQEEHLRVVLNDCRIRRALVDDERLKGETYDLARRNKIEGMLSASRRTNLKARLLFPIKWLMK